MNTNFEKIARELSKPGGATNWHLLSISFDPEFDIPERLKEYAKKYADRDPAKWNFVTSEMIEIDAITEQMGVVFANRNGTIDHTTHSKYKTMATEELEAMADLGQVPAADDALLFMWATLPTLPAAWATGSVRGLRARGGFEVDLAWAGGKLTRATLRAPNGGAAKLRYGSAATTLDVPPGKPVTWNGR